MQEMNIQLSEEIREREATESKPAPGKINTSFLRIIPLILLPS